MDTYSRINRMIQAAQFVNDVATDARVFRAPGRVNIIGEHTDYNDGLVLPTNTALYTWLAIKPRTDRVVSVLAKNFEKQRDFNLDAIEPSNKPEWIDYLKGVCAEIEATGITLCGAEIVIHGEIPIGGGLSSSASLELVMATAMLAISDASLPAQEIAKLCQRAEHTFAGVNCGIMDQFSITCCGEGQAILLDCRSLDTRPVVIPEEITLLITDSGVNHKLSDGGYNQRAIECQDAVAIIQERYSSVTSLRDVSPKQMHSVTEQLGDLLLRRCRHVVTEIDRVKTAFDALNSGDIETVGQLVSRSHSSLRDDFEVSCDEVESLVSIANACKGVLGSRMVGAGFGGCVLSIVQAEKIEAVRQQIAQEYRTNNGESPWMHTVASTMPAAEYSAT